MRCYAALAALGASLFVLTPAASADIIYNVSASLQYGGTLTGTFTLNNALTQVTSYNLVASGSPGNPGFTFPGFTYTGADSSVTAFTSNLIQFDAPAGDELRLVFGSALTSSGGTLTTGSYESEIVAGGRTVRSGSASSAAAVTPEPSSLVLLGTGLLGVGAILLRRVLV